MREHLQPKPGYNRACKTPQKWIGSAKTTETSAGNTTFYKYKIFALAAKFVISSPSPSLSLCHVGLCIVIYTASSFKRWAIESEIPQIRKMKAAEAWFFFWRSILSLLLFLWEWEWVREARYKAPMLLLLLLVVWQVSRVIQKYFRTRPLWSPAACTVWFYNREGWESYSALQSWLWNAPAFL